MSRKLSTNWGAAIRHLWIGLSTIIFMLVSTQAIMWHEYLFGTWFEEWSLAAVILASMLGVGALAVAAAWTVGEYRRSSVVVDHGVVVIRYGPKKYTVKHDNRHPLVLGQDSTGRYWLLTSAGDKASAVQIPVGLFPSLKGFLLKEGVSVDSLPGTAD